MSLREMTASWVDTVLDEVWGDEVGQVEGEDVWWLPGSMPRRIEVEGDGDLVVIEVTAAGRFGVEPTDDVLTAMHSVTQHHLLGHAVLFGEAAVARRRLHAHEADRPALQRTIEAVTHMSANLCSALDGVPGGGHCAEIHWEPPGSATQLELDESEVEVVLRHGRSTPTAIRAPSAGYL